MPLKLQQALTVAGVDPVAINKIKKPLPITLKFSGVVEGRTISGKVNAAVMGSFPFTAMKV